MPLQSCTANGTSGWRWGAAGKCYTGPEARQRAIKQGIAIEGVAMAEHDPAEDRRRKRRSNMPGVKGNTRGTPPKNGNKDGRPFNDMEAFYDRRGRERTTFLFL